MKLSQILFEAFRSAWANKVTSVIVAVLAAAMCLTTGLTVGRAAAARTQIADRLQDAGSRHLVITDARNLGFITDVIVDQVSGLSVVERTVAFTVAFDGVNGAIGMGGTRTPVWQMVGDPSAAVELLEGRWPQPGEALVSDLGQSQLGFMLPAGSVEPATGNTGASFPVVGLFRALPPFEMLDAGVVVLAPEQTPARRLDVIATTASDSALATLATVSILDRGDPNDLAVTSPLSLAQIEADVLGYLADFNHSLVMLALLAGAGLVTIVTFADVLIHRVEIGRRRALGISRWALVALLVTRSLFAGIVGAVAGSMVVIIIIIQSGLQPDMAFIVATAVLALVATGSAALIPATAAAHQDPVRVLRTP